MRFGRLPIDGSISGYYLQDYDGRPHLGVDFRASIGTPVYAPAAGISVQFTNDGSFGIGVCLQHDEWFTLYAHLSQALVSVGQMVSEGELIGYSGNTGASTGPHLHWQMCKTSMFPRDVTQNTDPLQYLSTGDEPMTPQEKQKFDQMEQELAMMKRVLCEWGMPGNLIMLDAANINMKMSLDNLNNAIHFVAGQAGVVLS